MRGGLLSLLPVPGAGILSSDELYCWSQQTAAADCPVLPSAVAYQSGLEFLVGGEAAEVDGGFAIERR